MNNKTWEVQASDGVGRESPSILRVSGLRLDGTSLFALPICLVRCDCSFLSVVFLLIDRRTKHSHQGRMISTTRFTREVPPGLGIAILSSYQTTNGLGDIQRRRQ